MIRASEMISANHDELARATSREAEEMAKYGITRVPVDYFHFGDFRYTNLKDAVAQAKRQQRQIEPAIEPARQAADRS